jgi:uncharacterized membrane protein
MRRTGNILLTVLWLVLAVIYSTPLWLPRFLSIDAAVSVDPPTRQWLLPLVAVAAVALPPSLLAAVTWWWVRRRRAADTTCLS